jgi:hypothetical protein
VGRIKPGTPIERPEILCILPTRDTRGHELTSFRAFQSLSALSCSPRKQIELIRTSLNGVAANIGLPVPTTGQWAHPGAIGSYSGWVVGYPVCDHRAHQTAASVGIWFEPSCDGSRIVVNPSLIRIMEGLPVVLEQSPQMTITDCEMLSCASERGTFQHSAGFGQHVTELRPLVTRELLTRKS